MSPRSGRCLLVLIATLPMLVGCYNFATPSYHPGDAQQVLSAISRRGVSVQQSIAGESACEDRSLIPNSLHLRGSVASDAAPRDIWIYTFREKSWTGSQAVVDACQAVYQAANPGATITRMDIPTYRAFGADWSPELTESLRGALTEAAQAGEPQ